MIQGLKLIKVDTEYCNYLREYDKKETRPFIGILFNVNNCEYFAPLSSPKPKHLKMRNTIDFFKLNGGLLGAINFNNMIPVKNNNYYLLDLNENNKNIMEIKYIRMLKQQLHWLNQHYIQVINKSNKLYELYANDRLSYNIKNRCCNFKLLEEKCLEYNTISNKEEIKL